MKSISIFFDGTGKIGNVGAVDNTNVFKLWEQVDRQQQLAFYIEGVGTDPRAVATTRIGRMQACIRGCYDQLLGIGASERVRRAYFFLANAYEKNDQIFLFGFSRGAFIARMLAGFIHRVGLLFADEATKDKVDHAFALYCADDGGDDFEDYVTRIEATAGGRREGIKTHFLGQWDEVEALDVANITADEERLLLQAAERERLNPLPTWIRNACHALALHEVRQKFEPSLWSGVSENTQSLKQVWFAGAHADVGGGYASDDGAGSRFSDIALRWMWRESKRAGLAVPDPKEWRPAKNDDIPHIPELWKFGGFPARVRSALASMAKRDDQCEYLHQSGLDRLDTLIESAYNQIIDRVTAVWREADSISMHAHLSQYFHINDSPELSPQRLASSEDRFYKFLAKREPLTKGELEGVLTLMIAFGREPHVTLCKDGSSPYNQEIIFLLVDALHGVRDTLRPAREPRTVVFQRLCDMGVWLEKFILGVHCTAHRPGPYVIEAKKHNL